MTSDDEISHIKNRSDTWSSFSNLITILIKRLVIFFSPPWPNLFQECACLRPTMAEASWVPYRLFMQNCDELWTDRLGTGWLCRAEPGDSIQKKTALWQASRDTTVYSGELPCHGAALSSLWVVCYSCCIISNL